MANLTYGEVSRDTANLPAETIDALLSRGFAHYFGNEQAAKLTAKIKSAVAAETNGKATDVERAAVQAYRAAHPDEVTQWQADIVAGALAALDSGKIGVRESNGPRESTDPVGVEVRKMAKARVMELLKAKSLKFPGKEEVLDLNGTSFTGAELIQRQIDRHGDKMRKEAEAAVAAAQRARQRAMAASAEDNEL